MEKREWEGRASDADVQVRKVIQQALCEIWGVCEAMNVYLRGVFCCPAQWKGERKQLAHSQARRAKRSSTVGYRKMVLVLYLVVLWNLGLEYAFRIFLRLSSVHRDRLSEPHSMPELSREDLFLYVPRGIVVVVIEADLSPSHVAGMCHGFETVFFSTM